MIFEDIEPAFEVLPDNVTFEHPLLISLRFDVYPEAPVFTADFRGDVDIEFFMDEGVLGTNTLLLIIRGRWAPGCSILA